MSKTRGLELATSKNPATTSQRPYAPGDIDVVLSYERGVYWERQPQIASHCYFAMLCRGFGYFNIIVDRLCHKSKTPSHDSEKIEYAANNHDAPGKRRALWCDLVRACVIC